MGFRLPNLFYSLQRGPVVLLHIFQRGGGVQMPISIETHINITCDFPGGWGLDPLSPSGSAHGQCDSLARIGSDEPVRPPFKLRNSQC